MSLCSVSRALISVSDKQGITELAQTLHDQGIEILSTGGTAKLLIDNNIPVIEVSDYTGFPEMMDGRVKTLHPKIHGGILARRDIDATVMKQHEIPTIDLVIVNLYPFEATINQDDCTLEDAIENIDIGGPTMVRASAKNHAFVTIVVNPSDYTRVTDELIEQGGISATTRLDLAIKAFEHTARYDGMIANYLGAIDTDFPQTFNRQYQNSGIEMRYGENPHQKAAFYIESNNQSTSISSAKRIQGKALSYNNIADTDSALECVKQFEEPACVIVKHANPCGVATAKSLLEAYNLAYATDPESAFGGIIAFNRPIDATTAQTIIERQFVEVIIAPQIKDEIKQIIATKKNIRLLECGSLTHPTTPRLDFKYVNGGLLVQEADLALYNQLETVTQRKPTDQEMSDLLFSWKIAKFVKSNAIIYAKDSRSIGIGAGQMSRVNSARIAAIKAEQANLSVVGSVMASDAFFPFRDGIDQAASNGITAVIQPGGSIRDKEVIQAADEHGMAMLLTGMRHFRH